MRPSSGVLLLCLFVAGLCAVPSEADARPHWVGRALTDVGKNPTGWRSKWCGKWIDMRVPGKWSPKASANARLNCASTCRPYSVAVMSNHIGVVLSCVKSKCKLLSGNGRGGKVDIKWYSKSRFIACRRPC